MVKNFLTLATLHAANYLLPLAITPYLARVLLPRAFGELAFCQAVIIYLTMFVDFGFGLSASRRIAAAHGKRDVISQIFWTTICAKTLLLTLSAVFLALLISLPSLRSLGTVLGGAFVMTIGACIFPTWLFQGLQRMTMIAIANIAARAAVLPLVFFVVKGPSDIAYAALISGGGGLLAGFIGLPTAFRFGVIGPFRSSWPEVAASIKESWPLFLSSAGVSLYTAANLILLRLVASPTQVAYFAGADKIRTAAIGLITVLTTAIFPAAVVSTTDTWPRLTAEFRYYWPKIVLGVCIFLGLFLGAPPIVRIVLGEKMLGSTQPLQVLAFVALMVPLNHVLGLHILVARGHGKAFARSLLLAGGVNLLLLPILGSIDGARGAALSPVIVEFVAFAALVGARRRLIAKEHAHTLRDSAIEVQDR